MDLQSTDGSEARFTAYVEGLGSVIGHADRAGPLRDYCLGLIMPCERQRIHHDFDALGDPRLQHRKFVRNGNLNIAVPGDIVSHILVIQLSSWRPPQERRGVCGFGVARSRYC